MSFPRRFWFAGFFVAFTVHVLIFGAIFWEPSESGAQDFGVGGIAVSLGPAGGSPGTVDNAVNTEEAEIVQPVESASTPEPPTSVEPVEETPVDPVAETIIETAQAELPEVVDSHDPAESVQFHPPQESISTQPAMETEPSAPETLDVRSVEQSRGSPVAESPSPVEETTSELVEETASEPASEPVEETVAQPVEESVEATDVATAPPEKPTETESEQTEMFDVSAASIAGTAGNAGNQSAQGTGSGQSVSGGGVPGASVDYVARLQSWLEKHKRYPRRARLRRLEGTALLHFVVDREGHILEYSIRQSSGHAILDEEVSEMIERASPLPEFPEDIKQAQLEFVVPVQFSLM